MLNRVGIGLFFVLLTMACSNLPGRVDLASLDCCSNLDTLLVVVETPAGKTVFNQYDPESKRFEESRKELDFLGSPGNWCLLPGTTKDAARQEAFAPLSMLVLGDALAPGTQLRVKPLATLLVERNGRSTYFLVGVPIDGRGIQARSFRELSIEYDPVRRMLENWLLNYRGLAKDRLIGWKEEGFSKDLIKRHMVE